MAKYCGNCGSQMNDDARVCGNCGTPFANMSDRMPRKIPGVDYQDPRQREKSKKRNHRIVAIIIVIVVLGILGAGVSFGLSFLGYKGTVRKIMAAYEDYDIDEFASLASEVYYIMNDEYYYDEYWESLLSSDMIYYENELGSRYDISYKITDKQELSKYRYRDLYESYEYYDEFHEDMLSEVIIVELEVTAKKGKDSVTMDKEIWLSKEGKSWKLLYLY